MKNLTLRLWEEADYVMLTEWWAEHGAVYLPQCILPKLGVITLRDCQPVAAMFLYMDNSVGVCFAEHPVTAPGQTAKQSFEALVFAMNFLKKEAMSLGYGIMLLRTKPAIARFAKKLGFKKDWDGVVCMIAQLKEEEV